MTFGSSSLATTTYGGTSTAFERIVMAIPNLNINLAFPVPTIYSDILINPPVLNIDLKLNPPEDPTITNYFLSKTSGFTTDSEWKHLTFKMNGVNYKSQINSIKVETEPLSAGSRCDFKINYNKGQKEKELESIIYNASKTDKTKHLLLSKGPQVEDFNLEIDYSNGSATNPVKIRSIEIKGYFIDDR